MPMKTLLVVNMEEIVRQRRSVRKHATRGTHVFAQCSEDTRRACAVLEDGDGPFGQVSCVCASCSLTQSTYRI